MALFVRNGGSRHTGQAAPPQRNIQANRRRAWIAFIISLMYNYACINYFHVGRYNILFSGCFFIAGGLIYLYREEISCIKTWIAAVATGIFIVGYYVVLTQWYSEEMIVVARLLLCMAMLILAMVSSGGILDNRIRLKLHTFRPKNQTPMSSA